jgi:TolA-binding protein
LKNHSLYKSVLFTILLVSFATATIAEENDNRDSHQDGQNIVIQSRTTSSFKDLLYSVWGRLQALSPQQDVAREPGTAVATLGMRGARLADRNMTPEAGLPSSTDQPENEELQRYLAARRYAETGDLDKVISELGIFIETYGDSELRPNALFALGISQAGTGDNASAIWTMLDFTDEYPQHPLSDDAREVIEELEVIELLDD